MSYQNIFPIAGYENQRDSLNPNGLPPAGPPSNNSVTLKIFGHSLAVHYSVEDPSTTPYTIIGEWMGFFARLNSLSFNGAYLFGQFSDHNAQPWPNPGSSGTFNRSPEGGNTQGDPRGATFGQSGYDTFFIMASNFLEEDMSVVPPFTVPPNSVTQATAAVNELYDNIIAVYPNARIYLYIHTPDTGSFGGYSMSRAQFTTYNNSQMGEYVDWHIALQNAVNATGRDLYSIPAYACGGWCLENMPALQGYNLSDLYSDGAPHGTENIYFLAALTCARVLFGQEIDLSSVTWPASIPQMLQPFLDNAEEIQTNIYNRLVHYNDNGVRIWD